MIFENFFRGQVPKDQMAPDCIEDHYKIGKDIVIISDGASVSYDSRRFARLVCSHYKNFRKINQNWISELTLDFASSVNLNNLGWAQKAAYRQGSFASLLAVKKSSVANQINLFAIGDSIAVLVDGNKILKSFPYTQSAQFRDWPELLGSNLDHNKFIQEKNFKKNHSSHWDLSNLSDPIILCMTDALGEWVLRNNETNNNIWEELLRIEKEADLRDLVLDQWITRQMRKDDITLIRILCSI